MYCIYALYTTVTPKKYKMRIQKIRHLRLLFRLQLCCFSGCFEPSFQLLHQTKFSILHLPLVPEPPLASDATTPSTTHTINWKKRWCLSSTTTQHLQQHLLLLQQCFYCYFCFNSCSSHCFKSNVWMCYRCFLHHRVGHSKIFKSRFDCDALCFRILIYGNSNKSTPMEAWSVPNGEAKP